MSRRLLDVVGGVEIRAKETPPPLVLEPGRRGRFEPEGPVYQVHRVNDCAAYLFRVYDPPTVREIGRDELDLAVYALLAALVGSPEAAYQAARRAHRAACGYRTITVSRGPVEPGVSRSTRFSERLD